VHFFLPSLFPRFSSLISLPPFLLPSAQEKGAHIRQNRGGEIEIEGEREQGKRRRRKGEEGRGKGKGRERGRDSELEKERLILSKK
jgi:hypothetical protein